MRTITVKNEKIHKLVTEYKEKALEVNKLTDDIEKIEKERNKVGLQIQKLKDKLNPIVEKETKDHVSEFEMVTNIQIGKEENEVEIDIFDQVEEFKEALRKKKAA
jgi:septal ring factor EnvC (AmiA/AmiB activator)